MEGDCVCREGEQAWVESGVSLLAPPEPGDLAQRKQADFSFLNSVWTHSYKLAHGFLKSVCNCQLCSNIRHETPSVFQESRRSLQCLFFLPTLCSLLSDETPGCVGGPLVPFSLCLAGSPDGPSFPQASLPCSSGYMKLTNFFWPPPPASNGSFPAPHHPFRPDRARHTFQSIILLAFVKWQVIFSSCSGNQHNWP